MTAEIAILNRSGIALAADSAVTIGQQRVWKSTNKLYSLGPSNDIGVLIYGSGDFVGFHWEIIVKSFREHVKITKFKTVKECSAAFFEFLVVNQWNDVETEIQSINYLILTALEKLAIDIDLDDKSTFRAKLKSELKDNIDQLFNFSEIENVPIYDEFINKFGDTIDSLSNEILKNFITKPLREIIKKYIYLVFSKAGPVSEYETGVVFAGYGEDEFFPYLTHNIVDGKFEGFVRHWEVDYSDLNTSRETRGVIVPLAQRDMMNLFMEGIGGDQIEFIDSFISGILKAKSEDLIKGYVSNNNEAIVESKLQEKDNDRIMEKFREEFAKFRRTSTVGPMMNVVSNLPREDMAEMAASLVELTSLRRKMDSSMETVGGPIDVAIISKGDGFVWVKRKNYFDINLNSDYIERRKIRLGRMS